MRRLIKTAEVACHSSFVSFKSLFFRLFSSVFVCFERQTPLNWLNSTDFYFWNFVSFEKYLIENNKMSLFVEYSKDDGLKCFTQFSSIKTQSKHYDLYITHSVTQTYQFCNKIVFGCCIVLFNGLNNSIIFCSLLNNGPTVSESVQFDDVDILPGIKSESQRSGTKKDDKYLSAFRALLSYPGIWCVSSYLLVGSVPFGLFNVAMGPYLLRHYDIEGDCSGYYFLVIGATYAVIAQFVGVIVDKGFYNYFTYVTFNCTIPCYPQADHFFESNIAWFLYQRLCLWNVFSCNLDFGLYKLREVEPFLVKNLIDFFGSTRLTKSSY